MQLLPTAIGDPVDVRCTKCRKPTSHIPVPADQPPAPKNPPPAARPTPPPMSARSGPPWRRG
jgi:hypothetical protein